MKKRNLLTIIICGLFVLGLAVNGAGTTLGAVDFSTVTFSDPYPTYTRVLELNNTATTPNVNNAWNWVNSNTSVIQLTSTQGVSTASVKGLALGTAVVVAGTKSGAAMTLPYKVVDSTNATSYTIAGGSEGTIASKNGVLPLSVTTVPAGAAGKIVWDTMNPAVATVSGPVVTAQVDNGSAIIVGKIIDKWGVEHLIPYHVIIGDGGNGGGNGGNGGGVDNSALLNDLDKYIKQGEAILATSPNPYTDESLSGLGVAVGGGKAVQGSTNPTANDIQNAIDTIKNAIDNLAAKPGAGLIQGDDGQYYKPVGIPSNVFEKVDQNGAGSNPPAYVYNPNGTPGDGNDKPAVKDGSGYYWVESTPPGNIWLPVENDGTLNGGEAIFGGNDRLPTGGDNKPANKFGNDWYANLGQNVWQKVGNGNLSGNPVGGGPDKDPTTGFGVPVVNIGGTFYISVGKDGDGNDMFYGDPKVNGNGDLDSTMEGLEGDDVLYYKDSNGNLTTTKPSKPGYTSIENLPNANVGDIVTIDGVEWVKISNWNENNKYVQLIMNNVIGPYQYSNNDKASIQYKESTIRGAITNWYNNQSFPTLKPLVVEVDIGVDEVISWPSINSGTGDRIHLPRKADIDKLPIMKRVAAHNYWLATPYVDNGAVGYQRVVKGDDASMTFAINSESSNVYARPVVWVKIP